MPRSMVMRLASAFCAVSESESSTPHSLMRLPNIKKPTSESDAGAIMPVIKVIAIGNMILPSLRLN